QIATLGRDHAAHAAPGHVLLVGGVAQTPALLRAVREVFGEPAGRDGTESVAGPQVVPDPSPTHAAVLGALALSESEGAWWPAAPGAAGATGAGAGAGPAAAGGARRVPLALAGAIGVLVVGGLGVAALQLTGDDEDPAGTP